MDEDDEDHHSDDSCLLHEFSSQTCSQTVCGSSRGAVGSSLYTPTRRRTSTRQKPCCSASASRSSRSCVPCPSPHRRPILTSSRPLTRLGDFEDLSSRIESLQRDLRSTTSPPRSNSSDPCDLAPCYCVRWDVGLLRALRSDPSSVPERRSDGRNSRVRQPGRADVSFTPRKGDLIIHHDKNPGRKVLEFYDPVCQRLHDGDILVRFKIDSYACEGIVQVKGSAYLYHRGFWIYLGKDQDHIARTCNY